MLSIWIDMRKFLFSCFSGLLILCLTAMVCRAQVYPIQSSVNLSPPYSGNLSDYTAAGTQRISVTLSCNDNTISNYRVKLRLTIEGLGITLRSKANITFEPLVIDGGSPLSLYGDDLFQYLDPRNLDFVGLSRTEYQRTGKLPEGVYRFNVEVLDYNRGTVVSNKGVASAWIILNDPPILNLPATNSKTRIVDPTNIPFTWTSRHRSSPNSAFTSEYVFRLIEIWPSNRNPNDAFLTQTPLYEIETTQSQLVYGPGEPALIPGRKYAWQVQARDTEGRDLFKNNGKSEVFVFQFGDAIEMPQNVRKETANATTISMRWEASSNGEVPEKFRIRYRPDGGSTWYEDVTTQYWHNLSGLQNNKAYDIQVRAESGRQVSDYTFNQRHSTTLPIVDENFQCGNPFNIHAPAMTTPLQSLYIRDVFKCADFEVSVREVTKLSEPGSFSGKGFAKVYMMNRANIEVTFSGTFNSQYQMVSGSIKSTYESGSKMSQLTEEMKAIGEKPPVLDSAIVNPNSTLITITKTIDSVYLNAEGKIVVLDEDGQTQTFEQKKNTQGEKQEMIVKDAEGNTWTVDKDGNISKAEAALAGVYSSRDSLNFVIKFRENETDQYGFDKDNEFPTSAPSKINDTDYVIGWKSVEQGKQDFVDGFVENGAAFPKKVGFKIDGQAMSIQPGAEQKSSKVIFPGAFDGDKQELVAFANLKTSESAATSEIVLGKLNVVTYEYIAKKVIVVPVNVATTLTGSELTTRLNKIYGQAVAGWQVTIDPIFTIATSLIDNLDQEESGNLASYNKKMREFNSEFKKATPTYDKNAFYIFLIKGTAFRFDAFMPFKRGIGYVFVDKINSQQSLIKTIAHELGHGAFNLRHTFDQHPSVTKQSTDNLMDYAAGEVLKKYQWDYIHDPESMVGWLQDDEEGAIKSLLSSKYVFMHDQLSLKSYASTIGPNEFTQDGANYVDSKLYQLDTAGVKTYIYFAYIWFHAGNIGKFDQLIEKSFDHALDSIRQNLNVKDFNLLAIVNAKYDTALSNGLKSVAFKEKFFSMNGLSTSCTKSIDDYLKSGSKKTFVNGLDAALKERADILLQKLKNCEVVLPEEIVIHYKRKGRNKYRTWGEFTIVGTDYKGYILEREKGDNPTIREGNKRHPAGTYELGYSEDAGGENEDFYYTTLYIAFAKPSYKLHCGNRADQSNGCLLINAFNPAFDKYPDAYQSDGLRNGLEKANVANSYPPKPDPHNQPSNPAFKLRKKVNEIEDAIKSRLKVDKVVKKIFIDESEEKEEL
jgi:hypothetical protein